jgi:hypothetical protein
MSESRDPRPSLSSGEKRPSLPGGEGGEQPPRGGWWIMAVAGGVLSGFAFSSLVRPSIVALLFSYAAPLPLFMVGLAFGWQAAAVAAAFAFLYVLWMLGPKAALFHLVSVSVAPVVLTRLARMWRPAAGGREGEAADAEGREWYPEGRLLLWTAFLAGGLMSIMLLLLGPDAEGVRRSLGELADAVLKATGLAAELPPDQAARIRDYIISATPPITTAMWMFVTLANFWGAARLTRAFGYPTRPWAPFWKLTFHPRAMAALAVASFATLLPGIFGLIGEVFATALLVAFFILGLAVIHALTLGNPWRPVLLAVLYFGLFFINWLLALPLVILGLADLAFGLREHYARPKGRDDPDR